MLRPTRLIFVFPVNHKKVRCENSRLLFWGSRREFEALFANNSKPFTKEFYLLENDFFCWNDYLSVPTQVALCQINSSGP